MWSPSTPAMVREEPAGAEEALAHVRQAARTVLADLSTVLDVLRSGEPGHTTEPPPGLSRLASMLDALGAAGLRVEHRHEGEARPLPSAVDLAAYRIVQESLTNAHKHGSEPMAWLCLDYTPAGLGIVVENAAAQPEAGRPRHRSRPHRPAGARQFDRRDGTHRTRRRRPVHRQRLPPRGVRTRRPHRPAGDPHMTIRVLLADDQTLIRAGFRVLVDRAPDLEVVGEATNGREAVELAAATRADVILMDIRMPGLDGIEATRLITEDEDLAGVRVLILTTFELDENVLRALRAGASGFLSKSVEPADLQEAIRVVAGGEALLSPKATRGLIARFLDEPTPGPLPSPVRLDGLTERERETMALVAAGLSNDEIGERLYVSPLTAKTHVNRAMMKLGARDRAQLVVFAYQSGLVRAGDLPVQ